MDVNHSVGITSNERPLGVVLIGAGMIAQRHVEALSNMQPRAKLLAIVSRHPNRAKYLAEHYAGPTPLFTSDIDAVAQMPSIRIAIVATPPSVRIELIRTLAQSGIHVLLEKPIARNVGEALEVIQTCEQAGTLLGVLFQHRARHSSRWAKHKLESGVLGRQGYVEIQAPLWRPQSYYDELDRGTYHRDGGGVLITQAIHTIDLALSLAGPVYRVQAMTATTPLHQMEAEDFAVAGLHFASGAMGSLVASTASFPPGGDTITIHCERGSMKLCADTAEIFWRDGRKERYPTTSPSSIQSSAEPPNAADPAISTTPSASSKTHSTAQSSTTESSDPYKPQSKTALHQAVIEDFIDAVEQHYPPLVAGRRALAAQQLIEAIETSSRKGQAIVLSQQTMAGDSP